MLQQSFERTIRQLCEDVLSELEPKNLPQRIIDHVQETFPVAWSTLWVTEQKNAAGDKRLRLAAAAGAASRLLHAENGDPAVYDFGEGLTGDIAAQRSTVNITKPQDFEKYQHVCKYDQVMYNQPQAGDKCRCVLGVPLLLKSDPTINTSDPDPRRVIGVLKLENIKETSNHQARYFTKEDVEIVEGYAAVIAVALEKAQMRADSIRIGAGLLKVSQKLLEELGERPNLHEIVRQTADVISAQACALWLRSGLQLRLVAAHGYPGSVKPGEEQEVPHYSLESSVDIHKTLRNSGLNEEDALQNSLRSKGLTVFVAKTTSPLNLKTADEVKQHFAWKGELDNIMWKQELGNSCYSLVAIPLVDDETKDLKGVFKIENKKPTIFQLQNYFTAEDQQLLSTLGNSISLSLITAERVDRLRRLEKLVSDIRVLENLDEALFSILKGLTHGGGLQYNRAMVFLLQETSPDETESSAKRLVCQFAMGEIQPRDWQLARETDADHLFLDLDDLLQNFRRHPQQFVDNPMMKTWRGREISLEDVEDQVIAWHVKNSGRDTKKYNKCDLSEKDILYDFVESDFVIMPMYMNKKLLGIIYADNKFTGNLINQFECEVLDLFSGMAGAIVQASQVPEALRKERDQAWRSFSRPAAHRLGTEAGIIGNEISLGIEQELAAAVPDASGRLPVQRVKIENSLKVIRQAVNRLRIAVKDYQKLSFEPEAPQLFDICKLVRETKKNTTDYSEQINVKFVCSDNMIIVNARREGLAYVLEELFINAWKEVDIGDGFDGAENKPKTINVYIEVKRVGDELHCVVCDDGPGVPASVRAELFRKPQRGRHGGTGLGLYIIGGILRENLGSIELLEQAQVKGYDGACFMFKFPVDISGGQKSLATKVAPVYDNFLTPNPADSKLYGVRVLVVEDTPDLRRHISMMLEPYKVECIIRRNEYEGLEALSFKPDLIIADINLEETGGDVRGGIKLAEKMQEKGYRIPIILVSYDPWYHLPASESPEFYALKERLCIRAVLDRNRASFNEELVAWIREGVKGKQEEVCQ